MLGVGNGMRLQLRKKKAGAGGGGPPPETFHIFDDRGGQTTGDAITDDLGSSGVTGGRITDP